MNIRCQIVCLFVSGLVAYAQGGSISGAITDADGVALANAEVQVRSSSGAAFQTKTGADGRYSLTGLPAGSYQLAAVYPGLQRRQQNVALTSGQSVRVDLRLADYASLGTAGEDRVFYADVFGAHGAPSGPTPRMADGKPDFSGMWHPLRTVDRGSPEMLPWAEALFKERTADHLKDLPSSRCLPYGATLAGTLLQFRVMQNSTLVALLYVDDLPREIYLDHRKHPDEPLAPFVGHSVGKWEGDTLVVDTVGFNDKTWVDTAGHPHTDKLHLTERFQRRDLGHLELEITIDDPGAYKSPWTIKKVSELAPASEELGQIVCTENNQDIAHLVGR